MRIPEIPLKNIFIGLFFAAIVAYSLFQARFIILGPSIHIDTPVNGQVVDPDVTVSGHADNIAFISLNDRPIFVDDKGNFSEQWIAPTGASILTVRARDRFGRATEKQVEVVVK